MTCSQQFIVEYFENAPNKKSKVRKGKASKLIEHLAQPKYRRSKFLPVHNAIRNSKRPIEIIGDNQSSTRLEQLAMKPVRCLLAARDEYRKFINSKSFQNYNMHIQKSVCSVYSRLANFKLPVEKSKTVWTDEDWERYNVWLSKNALPRKLHIPPIVKSEKKPINLKRLEELSKHLRLTQPYFERPFVKRSDPIKKIAQSTLLYEPSSVILQLSTPKEISPKYEDIPFRFERTQPIPPQYMHIKSTGLNELAKAKVVAVKSELHRSQSLIISKYALKCKASQHTIDLAQAKIVTVPKTKANPFTVSEKAKRKPTKKQKELYEKMYRGEKTLVDKTSKPAAGPKKSSKKK